MLKYQRRGITDQNMEGSNKVLHVSHERIYAVSPSLARYLITPPLPVITYSHPDCFSKVSSADHPL